jgi:hypothetical protein
MRKDLWKAAQHLNCPLLKSWFCFFYHTSPRVHFSADPSSLFDMNNVCTYTLHEGVAQGDPLSSLLFVATLSYILKGHSARFPNLHRLSVIDDICFIASPLVPEALDDLSDILHIRNLRLNKAKTTIFCHTAFPFPTPATFPYHTTPWFLCL